MNVAELDDKISNFLSRKQAGYPEIATTGRHGSRTVKYAAQLRASGQLLFTR